MVDSTGGTALKLCTVPEMQAWELAAIEAGTGVPALMARAGRGVARAILTDPRCVDPIVVLAGPGNNGGDALVAAQHLCAARRAVRCFLWRRPASADPSPPEAAAVASMETEGDAPLRDWLADAGTVVDGLLGTGRSRPAEGPLKAILEVLRQRHDQPGRPRVVAVDVPSGADANTGAADAASVQADVTVALGCAKVGAVTYPAAALCGELRVVDIGLPPAAAQASGEIIEAAQAGALLPPRPPDSNKGSFGKALVIGGSERYVGATCLTAQATYRAGAGLVTVATPRCVHAIVATKLDEAIFSPQPDRDGALAQGAVEGLAGLARESSAVAIGPGLSQTGDAPAVARALLAALRSDGKAPRIVVDADALNALSMVDHWWQTVPEGCVLTPHPGEMGRLMGSDARAVQADRLAAARDGAGRWRQVVVLKGANTIVARPDGRWWLMQSANPALATAGTGDVLCGTIAGLLAQGLEGWAAAVCAVWGHAQAGTRAADRYGPAGVLAGDLLAELPGVFRQARHAAGLKD